jgi:hypothetical protein
MAGEFEALLKDLDSDANTLGKQRDKKGALKKREEQFCARVERLNLSWPTLTEEQRERVTDVTKGLLELLKIPFTDAAAAVTSLLATVLNDYELLKSSPGLPMSLVKLLRNNLRKEHAAKVLACWGCAYLRSQGPWSSTFFNAKDCLCFCSSVQSTPQLKKYFKSWLGCVQSKQNPETFCMLIPRACQHSSKSWRPGLHTPPP